MQLPNDSPATLFRVPPLPHSTIFSISRKLFDSVATNQRFCLLTMLGRRLSEPNANFAFFCQHPTDLTRPGVRFTLTSDEITSLNPNTGTCPVFRSRRDAEITLRIYRRVPVLIKEGDQDGNPWDLSFMQGQFNMTSDSHLFHTREQLKADGWALHGNVFTRETGRMLPLYQGMMASFFDHRAADIHLSLQARQRPTQPNYLTEEEHGNPYRLAMPAYWVDASELPSMDVPYVLAFSSITSPMNSRTLVPFMLPGVPTGNNAPILVIRHRASIAGLLASLSSFVVDFCTRQKLGGTNLNYFYVKQFPVLPPVSYVGAVPWQPGTELCIWIADRVRELVYTAWDMQPFALHIGDDGPPFRWDEERRALLRAELDAAYFHLYGIERDDVDYILDTFPIVRRKDEAAFGEYRTKRVILEIYDAIAKAIETGAPYETVLNPPAGQGPRHPERLA